MPPSTTDKPKTCVVISYWNGRTVKPLHKLLSRMRKVDSGSPFDLVIVCNGGDKAPLELPARFDDLRAKIFNRPNLGYNIGAWEHGWRNAGDYDYFLFVQDDCFLKGRYWVSEFEMRFQKDPGMGLLGEQTMFDQMTWEYLRISRFPQFLSPPETWPEPVHPIDQYKALFESQGIPLGETATHLPSIILFSSRSVLEEIGGFPYFGPTYRDALASELAISRLIESKGYRLGKVRHCGFELIGHPQWEESGRLRDPSLRGRLHEVFWRLRTQIRMLVGHKNRAQRPGAAPRARLDAQPVVAKGSLPID